MNRDDFVKLIGSGTAGSDYLPVAFLLRSGYACAGYYHTGINEGLNDTCVLLNAHLIELQENHGTARPSIHDFNDFLEEIVMTVYGSDSHREDQPVPGAAYGKSIPLAAIPFGEIAVMYPVSHIGALMRRAQEMQLTQSEEMQAAQPAGKKTHPFFDLNRSEIVKLLYYKLW